MSIVVLLMALCLISDDLQSEYKKISDVDIKLE